MRKLKYIFLFFALIIINSNIFAQCNDELLNKCTPSIGEFKFLKGFPVRLNATKKGEAVEQVKYPVTLSSGVTYKIVACEAAEFEGKVIISLFMGMQLVGTSYDPNTKKHLAGILFPCNRSGVYNLSFYFEDGKEGCAMGVLSQQNQ